MSGSPPLRFVALVIGGWACARAVMLAPAAEQAAPSARAAPSPAVLVKAPRSQLIFPFALARPTSPKMASLQVNVPATQLRTSPEPPPSLALPVGANPVPFLSWSGPPPAQAGVVPVEQARPPFPPSRQAQLASRWSSATWAFVRRGDERSLASGGTLGGSQVGARLAYRFGGDAGRPLSLTGRLYAPANRPRGAEAALGVEWKPSRRLPITILAERRQALAGEGRSAFGIGAYGGFSDMEVAGRLRLDLYGQAGLVGLRARDPYADGSARLSLPVGSGIKLGGGVWAAAQPGVARVDVGPQASLWIPLEGGGIGVALDWRLRAAGDAAPGSGPALTFSTAF